MAFIVTLYDNNIGLVYDHEHMFHVVAKKQAVTDQ